jgi:DNA-binding LacI/PurR family transcriptional regulator
MSIDRLNKPSESGDLVEVVRQLVHQMAGQRLPSERDMAANLKISRPRLRTILASLQREGLVEPRPGSGTYALDPTGRRLRKVVLLIDSNLKLADDPFFSMLVECLQANLQAERIRCLVERIQPDDPLPPLEDGVFTLGMAGRAIIERQRPEDPPMVGLLLDAETRPNRRATVFSLDDREAGRTAANTLTELGYRRFIFFGRRNIPASAERWAGIEDIGVKAGVQLEFVSCHLNYADGARLGREMALSADAGKVAFIATNDWLAAGLQAGLHQQAAANPEPMTKNTIVVSFDGLPITDNPGLDIYSLAVPIKVIAADAVAELKRFYQSPTSSGRQVQYPLQWARRPIG